MGSAEALVRLFMNVMDQQLLSPEKTEMFFTELPTDNGNETGYAFGIGDNISASGVRYHGHSGSAVGARSILLAYPDKKLVVVILCNLNDGAINEQIGQITSAFRAIGE